ncbi:MAG: hypothetical protein IJW93_05570 [Clostridia bacterium]|nr:hypothetical protein [Clostridia bacterium]
MKYISLDRLQDFEFHDSEWELISWEKLGNMDDVTFKARLLNVHKDAAPNNSGVDMEIKEATIHFGNIVIKEYERMRIQSYDEEGNEILGEPQVIHKGDEARKLFDNDLKGKITVLYLVDNNNGEYELGGIGKNYNYFMVRFSFGTVKIEWNDYSGAAWYELNRHLQRKITLSTPNGDSICDVHILYHDEEVYNDQSNVKVRLLYDGRSIEGYGNDYFWVESFADLQKRLPDGVRLKCCLNCRHGNMCPFGNPPGEVFCTNGAIINSKDDMISYIDDNPDWYKNERFYTDVCEDFMEQTDDYYTYNDYLYWLNKQ